MSPSVREQADDSRIELGTTVSWPHIIAGATLLLVPAAVGLIMIFGSGSAPADAPQTDRAAAREAAPFVPLDPTPDVFDEGARSWEILPIPRETAIVAREAALPVGPEMLPRPKLLAAQSAARPPVAIADAPSPAIATSPDVGPLQPMTIKRRIWCSEEGLQARLLDETPEIDIEKEKGSTKKLLPQKTTPQKAASAPRTTSPSTVNHQPFLDFVAQREDLKGLPFRDVEKCQAPADQSKLMQKVSAEGRRATATVRAQLKRGSGSSQSDAYIYDLHLADHLSKKLTGTEWSEEAGMRLLVQMFQIERPAVRMQVIKKLAESKAANVGELLAQRAVFDMNPEVRETAIAALKDRPPSTYREQLLKALRYPWPPVADHAAEAIVALNDRDAVPDLTQLLEAPDPCSPTQNKEKKWVKAELVRVNHLGNCVLCHAPAAGRNDPVRGVVPTRGQTLPEVYYEDKSGDFVRADVTYLKQDFSLMHPVAEPNKWPAVQRFDYLIRQRELTAEEVKAAESTRASDPDESRTYPQRQSVLWALRELTGREPGGK